MSQKITSYPGREITPDELREGKYLDIVYKFEPRYSWAAGVAISRFLTELKDGKIVARKCNKCQRNLFPPRMYWEQRYRPPDEGAQVKETGQEKPFLTWHLGPDRRRPKTPISVAAQEIHDPDPG